MPLAAVMPMTSNRVADIANSLRERLTTFPMSLIDLGLRIGIGMVFWKSAMTKLANWDITVQLFANEYQVPLLPPDIAALLGTTNELLSSILLFVGLGTRLASLALLGLTAVIQLFVYPENWSDHLLWASILVYLLTRGAGRLSLDHLIARRWFSQS